MARHPRESSPVRQEGCFTTLKTAAVITIVTTFVRRKSGPHFSDRYATHAIRLSMHLISNVTRAHKAPKKVRISYHPSPKVRRRT